VIIGLPGDRLVLHNASKKPSLSERTLAVKNDILAFFVWAVRDTHAGMPHLPEEVCYDFSELGFRLKLACKEV
jgi:hypothetical protein